MRPSFVCVWMHAWINSAGGGTTVGCTDDDVHGVDDPHTHHTHEPDPRLFHPQTQHPSLSMNHIVVKRNNNSGPQVVLVSSLAFIGVVVLLHIWAKFTSR